MGISGLFSLKNVLLFSISFILTVKQVVPNDDDVENVHRSSGVESEIGDVPDVTGVRYRLCERDNFSLDMIITSSLMRFVFGAGGGEQQHDDSEEP